MTPDPREWNRQPAQRTQREEAAYRRQGESFDESCARQEQGWRLLCGPEPSVWHSVGAPGPMLRYGPYRTEP